MKLLLRNIVFVLSPVILLGALLNATEWWDTRQYPPTTQFVKSRWVNDPQYRYSVLPTVEKSVVRRGMTRVQVEAILGKPDLKKSDYWEYETQPPGIDFNRSFGFEGTLLSVNFNAKGNVASAQKVDWTD